MDNRQDEFLRKLVGRQGPEKAPEGFAEGVMDRIRSAGATVSEPILSPMAWLGIFLGAAALVATALFLDIPLINDVFSSTGIQKLSLNIFTNTLYQSFLSLFDGIKINATALIILAAVVSLVVIERVLATRRSSQEMMMF